MKSNILHRYNHSKQKTRDHNDDVWICPGPNLKDFYAIAEEEILNDPPASKGPKVWMAVYVYADHGMS